MTRSIEDIERRTASIVAGIIVHDDYQVVCTVVFERCVEDDCCPFINEEQDLSTEDLLSA